MPSSSPVSDSRRINLWNGERESLLSILQSSLGSLRAARYRGRRAFTSGRRFVDPARRERLGLVDQNELLALGLEVPRHKRDEGGIGIRLSFARARASERCCPSTIHATRRPSSRTGMVSVPESATSTNPSSREPREDLNSTSNERARMPAVERNISAIFR
jgi:hypothetical protein